MFHPLAKVVAFRQTHGTNRNECTPGQREFKVYARLADKRERINKILIVSE